MEQEFIATLSSKGQLTLPKCLRKVLKVERGSTLLLRSVSEGVLLRRAEVRPVTGELSEKEWDQLRRLAKAKGRSYKSGRRFLKSLR